MKAGLVLALAFFLAAVPMVHAQVSYYGVDNVVNPDGSVAVKMTITFNDAVKDFGFLFMGKVANFNATSNAGPVDCKADVSSATSISCTMPLSLEKRTLEMSFTTNDLVKGIDGMSFFSGDFGLNRNVDSAFVSVKLPEGMILVTNSSTYPILPSAVQTLSDGRRIIVTWSLSGIMQVTPLKFQLAYEPTTIISNVPDYWVYSSIAIAAVILVSFFIIRSVRKPKEVILSVLDEYERSVMDCIVKAGGTISQKKIVQDTNLSKAKVSRVIKSLVERGLIESERTGRTSKIKLVKKKFGAF